MVRKVAEALCATPCWTLGAAQRRERCEVSAQFIDGESQTVLWRRRFDRHLADVFALQDAVARALGEALAGGGEGE